jgi:hypothetical protein
MDRRIFLKSTLAVPIACPMRMMLTDGCLLANDKDRSVRVPAESASAVGMAKQFVHLRVGEQHCGERTNMDVWAGP